MLATGGQNDRHEEIAVRAYQLWQERGSPLGSPDEDWLRAEQAPPIAAGSCKGIAGRVNERFDAARGAVPGPPGCLGRWPSGLSSPVPRRLCPPAFSGNEISSTFRRLRRQACG
ncbi:MAG TPA: DUF2934 domain-containing protein [Terriglobia bacterium]|nr:DUF2934 domain-containing protein [Terriglobia bacterium]